MAKTELNNRTNTTIKIEEKDSLKGTLASVFLLGLILIVIWVGVYTLYSDRF